MNIPQQIEAISIARAANAAYYEYLDTVRKAADLVKRMAEDLEYFRRHAMTNPNANKGKKQDGDTTPQDDTAPAE